MRVTEILSREIFDRKSLVRREFTGADSARSEGAEKGFTGKAMILIMVWESSNRYLKIETCWSGREGVGGGGGGFKLLFQGLTLINAEFT